jgi:hypothetical protein
MYLRGKQMALVALLCVATVRARAQELKLFDLTVQVHGFASQGFVYTDHNNWLTMHRNRGSGAFTDFGFNVSTAISDKLRIGAQLYDRNLGNLGEWHPSLSDGTHVEPVLEKGGPAHETFLVGISGPKQRRTPELLPEFGVHRPGIHAQSARLRS